jgi:hypothetical protein
MPKPVKDKKSGIFYIRGRVPIDLVAAFGRAEFSKSLRTRDPSEAKAQFAVEYALFQKRFAALRATPKSLPFKKIVSMAGRVYHELMTLLEDEPGETALGWSEAFKCTSKSKRLSP